jgi:hypothetical protein
MFDEKDTAPVEVVTRDHRYSGWLVNRGSRIADVLGDNSDVVQLYDAAVLGRLEATGLRCGDLCLRKDQILFVAPQGSHEAPAKRLNKLSKNDRFQAIVVIEGYVLAGLMHLPPRTTAAVVLAGNVALPRFLAMTSVVAQDSATNEPMRFDVVVLRRAAIEAVELSAAVAIAAPLSIPGEPLSADQREALLGSLTGASYR